MDTDSQKDSFNVDSNIDLTTNEDDDIVEVDADDIQVTKQKGKRPRKLTSAVWSFFEKLPEKSPTGKQMCKCKKCSATFICDSRYGTGNLKRHLSTCVRRDTRDVGQLIVGQNLTIRSTTFEVEKFRELLIAAMVMHELLLSFVEYKGIRAIFSYLHPDVTIISRNTAKADLFKMYKVEKARMKNMFQESQGMICLTGDLWTSIATDGYLAVTVHFVDHDWVLQKRLLDFSFMPPPHTGVALSEKVYSILEEWGIEKKIFSVTLDNASSNNVFVGLLKEQLNRRQELVCGGEFFHLRCCAHILNLIVHFLEFSIVSLLRLRLKICSFLGVFYEITCLFSGSVYPTSNLFFPAVFMAYLTLHESLNSIDEYMHKMAELMMAKFEKYWCDFNLPLAIVVILDPRYKVDFVDWSYNELYGSNSLQFQEIISKLNRTFNEYVAKSAPNQSGVKANPSSTTTNSEMISGTTRGVKAKFKEFDKFHIKDFGSSAPKTQLEQYLEEPRIDRNTSLDILEFWKINKLRFPDLAAMARDILSMPVTTVASESTFSVGGRVLDQYRSSLKPDTVQALICTRDWLFGDTDSVNAISLDQLTEDIMSMDINSNDEVVCSTSESNSMVQEKKG